MRVGETIAGLYRVLRSLGEGGMGEVFLAERCDRGLRVAIKALKPEVVEDEEAIRRFQREAQAAAALRHPGVTEVYEVGHQEGGGPYIVMEHLEGESLAARVARSAGGLDEDDAATIAIQVLGVLAAVHEKQIVHRDLKPENVFLCEDQDGLLVKLLDFGVSKCLSGPDMASSTLRGELVGSIPFMAPEQATGEGDLDERVDLWGVGAVLYYALTGHAPFTGTVEEVIQAIVFRPVPPVSRARPGLSSALDAVVGKALEKSPSARYRTAADFRAALVDFRRARAEERGLPAPTYRHGVLEHPAPSTVPPPAAAAPTRAHAIEVVHGREAGRIFQVGEEGATIGRGEGCDIRLTDEGVSRRHAKLRLTPEGLVIVDLGSSHGLRLNGIRALRAVLRDGDRIMVGTDTLVRYAAKEPREG